MNHQLQEDEEMKKFTKLTSVVLSAMLAVSMLAGCGDAASASAPAANSADNSAEASAPAASGDAKTFKIGAIGPFTGDAAIYGLAVKNGADIAVKEINLAGGINGYQIEYNSQDDELDNEKSVNAYNALKDWGMQVLIGSTTSGCSIAVSAESSADNMFQLTPSGSAADCIATDNAFQVCFNDPNQGVASAQYIGTTGLATKVAVIYNSQDPYSSGIYAKFAKEAENQPFEIVSAEAFTSDSKTDFSVQLQKANDKGAELVFLPIYYQEASLILTQAASAGYSFKFFGCDGLDGILGVDNFNKDLAEGVMLLTPFAADATDERTQAFVKNYQANYGEIPNQFAADAYDAVYIIKAAIEAAGATPDMSVSDLCDAMKAQMSQISVDGLTGLSMTWDAQGAVNKAPKAMEIKNGEYSLIQ